MDCISHLASFCPAISHRYGAGGQLQRGAMPTRTPRVLQLASGAMFPFPFAHNSIEARSEDLGLWLTGRPAVVSRTLLKHPMVFGTRDLVHAPRRRRVRHEKQAGSPVAVSFTSPVEERSAPPEHTVLRAYPGHTLSESIDDIPKASAFGLFLQRPTLRLTPIGPPSRFLRRAAGCSLSVQALDLCTPRTRGHYWPGGKERANEALPDQHSKLSKPW